MNLARFFSSYVITADEGNADLPPSLNKVDLMLSDVIDKLGGKTFQGGLYRIFRGDQILDAMRAIVRAFPQLDKRVIPFGYDWLGRHFVIDLDRIENGAPQVLMVEIGAGEIMQIPVSIIDFHEIELVEYADDVVALTFYEDWKSANPNSINYHQCAGYRVPLFLGGEDNVNNLEISDLSVYVEICAQLLTKARTLLPGQKINNIAIED